MRFLDLSPSEQRLAALDFQNYAGEDPRYAHFSKAPVEEAEEYLRKINMPYDKDEDDFETWEDPNVPRSIVYHVSDLPQDAIDDYVNAARDSFRDSDDEYERYLGEEGEPEEIKNYLGEQELDEDEYLRLMEQHAPKMIETAERNSTKYAADVNGDSDTDVIEQDTDGNGHIDTATVVGDTKDEAAKGIKKAAKDLAESPDAKSDDITSTGKTKKELSFEDKTVSDARKKRIEHMTASWGKTATQRKKDGKPQHSKDCSCYSCQKKREETVSDIRQKNIIAALKERLY